jgi:adenylylsulfate kinase
MLHDLKKIPAVLWFTGLSGSGKSTIAEKLVPALKTAGIDVEHLDGDSVREIFPQTGFTKEERDLHIKRMGFMASLLEKHGVTVVCTFVSPYKDTRNNVRNMCRHFIEIYISTPFDECARRDVKGLYAQAKAGHISHFTGLDDPYEPPENPEINIDTTHLSVVEAVEEILGKLGIEAPKVQV